MAKNSKYERLLELLRSLRVVAVGLLRFGKRRGCWVPAAAMS